MTNLQEGSQPVSPRLREQVLMGLPIAVGAVVAMLLFLALVLPTWLRLRGEEDRVAQLAGMEQRIPLLQGQLRQMDENEERAQSQQRQVLGLISGSGQIQTFMAQVDREAARHRVQLDVLEPLTPATAPQQKAQGGVPAPADGKPAPPPAPKASLEATGLGSTQLLLTAKGRYPDLLAFLRSLEALSLLVVQSDLNLTPGDSTATPAGNTTEDQLLAALNTPPTVMKLTITLYSPAASPEKAPAPAAKP